MQLPSNKVAVLFVLVVLVVTLIIGGDIFFDKIKETFSPKTNNADIYLKRNTTDNSSVDTDGDGLIDWQESLYGSNPDLYDTDGDGTSDGDEIKEGRDPSVAGPNDALVTLNGLLKTDFEVEGYKPGTLTDDFSKEFFLNYLNLKQQGQIGTEISDKTIENLGNQVALEVNPKIMFSEQDLVLVDFNKENLGKYAEEVAIIYTDYLTQIDNIKNLPDEEYLNRVSELYSNLSNVLSQINIPAPVKNVHVELLNAIYNKSLSLKSFSDYESDPLKTFLSVKTIREADAKETDVLISLNDYFEDNDIIFTDNKIIRFWNFYE